MSYHTHFLHSDGYPAQPLALVSIYYHFGIARTSMFQNNTSWSYRLNWVRLGHTQPLIITGCHPDVILTNLYVKETSFITSSPKAYFMHKRTMMHAPRRAGLSSSVTSGPIRVVHALENFFYIPKHCPCLNHTKKTSTKCLYTASTFTLCTQFASR